VLGQLRSVIVDLLLLTGLDQIQSTEALPPPPQWEPVATADPALPSTPDSDE
jgi:hypothetical protein